MEPRLQRSTPEAQGVSSTVILDFIEAVHQQSQELHSVMLLRHGAVIAEGWWSPYRADRPHMLFSLSKSFTSTAIGLAVAEGLISIDDSVLSVSPRQAPPEISDNLTAMKIRHLLTMSTGHIEDSMSPIARSQSKRWVRKILSQPVPKTPGTHFVYNSGATYMLSAIIQKVTGQTLLDYLRPRLLEPLGIEGAAWQLSPEGIHTGGWGLSITTEDIACFGQLYLQKGQWQGKQILPVAWVETASAKHSDNGSSPDSDWEQGYGYQFWRCRHNAYRGDGAFGQYCVIMPDQDAVLVITGGIGDMQVPLNLVWKHLLPAMQHAALPENAAAHTDLRNRLSELSFAPPQGRESMPTARRISGQTYVLGRNTLHIKSIRLDFPKTKREFKFRVETPTGIHQMVGGLGEWREGLFEAYGHSPHAVVSGVWTAEDTFVITQRFYETPFCYTHTCQFKGSKIAVETAVNVSFNETKFSAHGRQV